MSASEQESAVAAEGRVPRGLTRRDLFMGAGGVAALMGLGCVKFADAKPVVRPPGGQDESRLISSCIRCERCVEACPRDIIRPAHIEDGIVTARTPQLCFDEGWCDWCGSQEGGVPLCSAACPTLALGPAGGSTPDDVLGIARITEDWCLAYRLIGCRYCYDACEHQAIVLDDAGRPHVVSDACNGCGACEYACVSLQSGALVEGATARAITVVPLEAEEVA